MSVRARAVGELCNANTLHRLIAEGRQAIKVGDQLANSAMMHTDEAELMMEDIWTALDKYSEAGMLGRGRDIETEAIATARRGKIYARVLRNEALARPLLHHAMELAASLAPRSFHGVAWYEECKHQRQQYQESTFQSESRKAERERQEKLRSQEPVRQKMKAELDALDKYASSHNVYKLLEHIYSKYPPRADSFLRNKEKVLKEVKDANADTIKKVLIKSSQLHYHPDKNIERIFGVEWHVLCMEISKHLNGKYNDIKSG